VRWPYRPWRVVTDVGTEEVQHGVTVVLRVARDAFERVHPADPDVDGIAADLVNGPRKAVGDLPLPADVHRHPAIAPPSTTRPARLCRIAARALFASDA